MRTRIVDIMGKLGGISQSVIAASANTPAWMGWDCKKYLNYDIPFRELKPSVILDDLLPRITDLAKNAADRQTKVS